MDLGFVTSCLPDASLESIADWAAGTGFDALEVAAWPAGDRPDSGPSHLDPATLTGREADRIHEVFARRGLRTSALAFYDNNLHGDAVRRAQIHEHLLRCVDAAVRLGCPLVGTFIGRDPAKSVSDNLRLAALELPPLVEYAEERGVHIVIENCPMEGWHPDGNPGNLAYSPELWEWMFWLGFYLNFDPSHLIWLGIDPVTALRPYVGRVLHAQAKDTELDLQARNRYGVFGRTIDRSSPWDVGWSRYRVPGCGQIDWAGVVGALAEGGFNGTVSVEHEDPIWGGTDDRIMEGLTIAYHTLRPLVLR